MIIGTERPYPPTGLSTQQWRDVPIVFVRFDHLTTTQDGVFLHAVFGERRPGSDVFPHVVEYEGILYLEDGHTRVAREFLRGYQAAYMRVLFESGPESD